MSGKLWLLVIGLAWGNISVVMAQYFGQNKPGYEVFHFKVVETPNFEIYHYLDNPEVVKELANFSEQWYRMHQAVFQDTFLVKNPMIFYNDHADFQQTNAISGSVGVGTGGVTEALKNRVILPIAMSNQQTFHVLGHELVHAFQYNLILNGDSTSLRNLANLPLWMVEGLAEYMSIGSVDPHTAMWMRDAVMQDDIPSLKDLDNPKYFPYRYGQAFWAFLTASKGDDVIEPLFVAVAQYGMEVAVPLILGMTLEELSDDWVKSIRTRYEPYVGGQKMAYYGEKLISESNAGRMNVSPVVSPDGKYVIFLSEKDLFSTDLYLADTRTGEVIRKVASAAKDGHIDDLNYIESAGTWSPDSKWFAYVAFQQGRNVLVIKEALTGKTIQEITVKDVQAFHNPNWSPDGREIVFSGLVGGRHDLYAVNIRTEAIRQLTRDPYSELHPHWSADGKKILFASDQRSFENGRSHGKWVFNLAELDVESGQIQHYDVFPGADNLNPVYGENGNILFLSNRDGFRNLYEFEPGTGQVFQKTRILTGISGITAYAPAISFSARRDRMVYTVYEKNQYAIFAGTSAAFLHEPVDPLAVNMAAGTLPQADRTVYNTVNAQLETVDRYLPFGWEDMKEVPYHPKFKLDYIGGGAGVGIGTSSTFGTTTGMAGAVDMLFSDILGDNQLFASMSLNGEITDFGTALAYTNQEKRIGWGVQLSHIPIRQTRGGFLGLDTFSFDDQVFLADHVVLENFRIFEDRLGVFGQLPFSRTLRLEGGASFARYYFRIDQINRYYDAFGQLIFEDREKLEAPEGFNLVTINAALVGDNSVFGMTAPLNGTRYRFGLDQYAGRFDFTAITADFRTYHFFNPVSLGLRIYHYGRYGDSEGMFPLYIGNPWFVRGYNSSITQELFYSSGRSFDELLGSKMLVSNFEVRIPFTGPERLATLKSKFLFSDLNIFVDGGLAWDNFSQFDDPENTGTNFAKPQPFYSTGVSIRVNLFGAMVIEPYYAFPLFKGLKHTRGVFGLNILPGW
jgi:Tol biopolymer transport system component